MDHIGIAVHERESQIYSLAEGGEVVGARPHARILIEASTDSEWVAPGLAANRQLSYSDSPAALLDASRHRYPRRARRRSRRVTVLAGLVLDARR
jgi:hypothetical protein